MTTRYHLPEGATSASAEGILFLADELGQIDVSGAHPNTVATLVRYAGARPVRTAEDIEREAADAAEKIRFDAAVAAMQKGHQQLSQAEADAAQTAADLQTAAVAAQTEADTAERAVLEAVVAAADVEAVTPPAPAETDDEEPRGLTPPKRKKNG